MPKNRETSSLLAVIDKFNKTMGEGIVHSADTLPNCTKIQSSMPMYNYVTDGGFPVGRVIEHYGENGSLKSYTAYDAIAQFQFYDWANREQGAFVSFSYKGEGAIKSIVDYKLRKGYKPKDEPEYRRVVLVDLEATYTPDWGRNFGIDNEGLILIRPSSLDDAVDIVQTLLTDAEVGLIVIDSLSAVGTTDEVEKSMEEHQMATNAKFWNKAFRKFQSAMLTNPTKESTLLVINSAYQKVGIAYGDPEVVRNGEQLKRAKTLSVRFQPLKMIQGKTEEGDINVGRNVAIQCKKNKTGVNGRTGNMFLSYIDDKHVRRNKTDIYAQILDLALRFGVVTRKGAWYEYGSIKVSGMDNFVDSVVEKDKMKEIEVKTYEKMGQ